MILKCCGVTSEVLKSYNFCGLKFELYEDEFTEVTLRHNSQLFAFVRLALNCTITLRNSISIERASDSTFAVTFHETAVLQNASPIIIMMLKAHFPLDHSHLQRWTS
jgi:hypothetical protein